MDENLLIIEHLHTRSWFIHLPNAQRELLQQSFFLLEEVEQLHRTFFDYSFVVMPAAKAYEGFIKDLVYHLGLISKKRYVGKRFRVGKALNPELAHSHPNALDALYDDLVTLCGGEEIPALLWKTWKECRNEVFHYFMDQDQHITLFGAKEKLHYILEAMDKSQELFSLHILTKSAGRKNDDWHGRQEQNAIQSTNY